MTSRRKPSPKTARKNGAVRTIRPGVHQLEPMLREEVLRLANGDASRIEVRSRTEAIVR